VLIQIVVAVSFGSHAVNDKTPALAACLGCGNSSTRVLLNVWWDSSAMRDGLALLGGGSWAQLPAAPIIYFRRTIIFAGDFAISAALLLRPFATCNGATNS
jgi:hypothetical protein